MSKRERYTKPLYTSDDKGYTMTGIKLTIMAALGIILLLILDHVLTIAENNLFGGI